MRAGFDIESFWEQTARTLSVAFEGKRLAELDAHNARMSLAWHTAVLSRMTGKLPKLDRLLQRGPSGPRRPQTTAQMVAMAKMITVAMGGEVSKDRLN